MFSLYQYVNPTIQQSNTVYTLYSLVYAVYTQSKSLHFLFMLESTLFCSLEFTISKKKRLTAST